jgi:hypothetical protein
MLSNRPPPAAGPLGVDRRVVVAQLKAHEDAAELVLCAPDKKTRELHVAMGDPQASLDVFFKVLEANGLLGDDGRLRPEVGLVSLGDHFDWGRPHERERATEEGTALLSWLAAHPPDQVQIIFGNHDLARVGELSGFTNETFLAAQRAAEAATLQPSQHAAFLLKYPTIANPEVITRDFACFDVRQRLLVTRLLRARRARLAIPVERDLLLIHAGVTMEDLELLGSPDPRDAHAIAIALNDFLDQRVASWTGGPLDLSPLHEIGSAKGGEAKGILSHRPANPARKKVGRAQRRYDPRELPRLTQVIGHVNDKKCRELMGEWAESQQPVLGQIRSLKVTGAQVQYRVGCDEDESLIFLDGAMSNVTATTYELFDLELRQPLMLR